MLPFLKDALNFTPKGIGNFVQEGVERWRGQTEPVGS
jgi:hypothetical protein